MREIVRTDRAPGAVGPYSQAVIAGGFVWASGQIPLDPATGTMVKGGIEAQTRRVMDNLQAVLEAADSGMDRLVRVTIYLADLADFDAVNGVYGERVGDPPPARVCIQAAGLPKGARIEVDGVAVVS